VYDVGERRPAGANFYNKEGWFDAYEWEERYPVRPIWGGLLLNVLFFASAAYFPALGLLALGRAALRPVRRAAHRRRERRAGRPLCPRCRYPVLRPDAPCPECGSLSTAR